MKITEEMVQACKTKRGGFSRETVRAFGQTYPLTRGWTKRIIGMDISESDYQRALDGAARVNQPAEPSVAGELHQIRKTLESIEAKLR